MTAPCKTILSVLAALLLTLPALLTDSGKLYATDLSYPPPGTSIRYVDTRRGEHNTPDNVDRLDARRDRSSHTIIQPGHKPYRAGQQQAKTKTGSTRVETLDWPVDTDGYRTGRPMLWKLDAAGTASSYIMGTIHMDDDRVMDLSDTVLTRLRSADRLMLELKLDQRTSLDVMRKMMFTDGRTLKQVIGEDLYSEVSARLAERAGHSNAILSVLKPWAAMVILLRPDNRTGTFLDKQLSQIARNDRIPVLGLETVDEQLSAFDRIALEDQADLLRSTVEDLPDKDDLYQRLLDAYIEGDLDRIVAASKASEPRDQRLAAIFRENLITQRNRLMYERMQHHLQEGNTFIAVGALHLPGEQGLLAMLERDGFRLTRLEYGD